ncbi:LTA synthase family protein [Niveibacterium sp. SC-1]|uniref:LTA synthase family protein n=1 Tax=Niveibacterium sp. SC-1 TaxID=3135646 RepID=UPI00311FFC9E
MSWVLPPMLFAAGLSIAAEAAFMRPRPVWRRPAGCWVLHLGGVWLLFAAGLLAFRRPWFAACQPLAWHFLILAVNAVKRDALREPFLFQDFEYFSDMLRHPRLYLPFFGYLNALMGVLAATVFIVTGVLIEPALASDVWWGSLTASAGLAVAAFFCGALATRRLRPSFDAESDVRTYGLAGALFLYAREERRVSPLPARFDDVRLPAEGASSAAHVVVVQSESFFDARRVCADVAPAVYEWFDSVRATSAIHGLLTVPAWGANTVRSEFAFLSGLRNEQLGVHQFNPYRRLREVGTVAHAFRRAGYRTVCVHPYAAAFYARDRQFPLFGFDEFIDIEAFDPADKVGAYVGDVALGRRVAAMLEAATEPLFVFTISMENHGPLHLEQIAPDEEAALYRKRPSEPQRELSVYLRHVLNAGKMQSELCERLSGLERESWLCWYGDHLPIMPSVYRKEDFEDSRTDYFVWSSRQRRAAGERADMHMADLAAELIGQVCNGGRNNG